MMKTALPNFSVNAAGYNCSGLCGLCKWTTFCPMYWKQKTPVMPDRKDRKYWPGNPDRNYHRR